jgi:hypothetical protein
LPPAFFAGGMVAQGKTPGSTTARTDALAARLREVMGVR